MSAAGRSTSANEPSRSSTTKASRHAPSITNSRNGQVVEQFVGEDHTGTPRRWASSRDRPHPIGMALALGVETSTAT